MYTSMFGKKMLDDVDNAVIGARVVSGACYFGGGCVHIPAIKAVANSDLQNFWKFVSIALLGGNAIECFRNCGKEYAKAIDHLTGADEKAEDSHDDEEEEEEEDETEQDDNVVEFSPSEENTEK